MWARDVAGLDRRRALDTLAWMASTLVGATIAQSDPARGKAPPARGATGKARA